jgi:hypothetical protein
MEAVVTQVRNILISLGDSPKAVAETLGARGIKGVRNTARFLNPIVRFVQASLQSPYRDIDLTEPNALRVTLPDGTTVETSLPPPVREFLVAFDHGAHPEVESP